MIPLTTVGKAGKESGSTTRVNFAYLTQIDPFGAHGELIIDIPACDIPISHFFVSLYLPEGYRFGEFETNLRAVRSFSSTPPIASRGKAGGGDSTQQQQYHIKAKRKMAMKMEMEEVSYGAVQYEAGTSAVAVDLPTTKVVARFEQLLVMPSPELGRISVEYARVSRGCCGRRHATAADKCCIGFADCLCCCCTCCTPDRGHDML
jgi:hypothetical protein